MEITIKGTPKEIADLVLEMQSQQSKDNIFSVNFENLHKVVKEELENHKNVHSQF